MLRFLSGKVASISDSQVVLDVSGLGFELLCTARAASLCREGESALLIVYLQFSDAGASLFGFADERERDLFLKLTTVKGIGGKTAMNILKSASADRIIGWILSSDVDSLSTIPGIGKKTAERLCFEMKRHLGDDLGDFNFEGLAGSPKTVDLAMEALRTLGFAQGDTASVFRKLKADGLLEEELSAEELIRRALKELKRN